MTTDHGPIAVLPLAREDAEAIVVGERDAQPWATDYPSAGDVAIASAALAGSVTLPSDANPWGLYAIVEASSGLRAGGIGFKHAPNDLGEVEIGYGVCASRQGRGFATAAVLAMCEIARTGARTVVAETERENVASQRVLEKSGFTASGTKGELILWRRDLNDLDTEAI
jgi:ribosomal-protein-alanine N-acetyltransferase